MVVSNDAVTAHLGALGGEPGAVIVAGTGAIALAATHDGLGARGRLGIDARRRRRRLLDRRALALALATDGRGGASRDGSGAAGSGAAGGGDDADRGGAPRGGDERSVAPRHARARGAGAAGLRAAAEARFGPLAQIARAVYDSPDPVATVAAFTRDVADLARGGDEAATAIFAAAGAELARTVTAAIDRTSPPVEVVSWSGGVFAAGELILAPLRAHLPAGVELRAPLGDGLDGAARLLERPTLFRDLIHG